MRPTSPDDRGRPHRERSGADRSGKQWRTARERAVARERAPARPAPPARAVPAASAGPATGEQPAARTRPAPVRRLLSLGTAAFAAMLGVGLIFGAETAGVGLARVPYAFVIFGVQALFVLAFTMALRPPGIRVVAGVGVLTAAAADVAAVAPQQAMIAPLGYVAAGGFVAGVVGQLIRREGRIRATESLGATLVVVVGVVAFATLIVLTRLPSGTQAIWACLGGAGVGLVVARLADVITPWPRLAPQVPRGALGVVLGAMLGTVTAAVLGSYLRGLTPTSGALLGLATAVGAVLADLSVGYAEAGRRMPGELPTLWVARHLQGPLAGFALAAPLAYAMTEAFLVDRH